MSVNSVVLVGRLTKDPEVRKTQSNLSTCSFTVAVDRKTKEKQADFINCVAWRQSADYLSQYGHKGDMVCVEGSINTRNYEDKAGAKVYVTEVVANAVSLIQSKPTVYQEEQKYEPVHTEPVHEEFKELKFELNELPFY